MARLEGSLIKQYRKIHTTKKTWSRGGTVQRYVKDIARIVQSIPTKSILDYGCSRGNQYTEAKIHEHWGGIMPTLFDPGVPGLDELPDGSFDGVICTGVLEHIPESEVGLALSNLSSYADKWCFLVVGLIPTNKRLLDGRQAHVTLMPKEWWEAQVEHFFDMSETFVDLRFES